MPTNTSNENNAILLEDCRGVNKKTLLAGGVPFAAVVEFDVERMEDGFKPCIRASVVAKTTYDVNTHYYLSILRIAFGWCSKNYKVVQKIQCPHLFPA